MLTINDTSDWDALDEMAGLRRKRLPFNDEPEEDYYDEGY